MVKGKRVVSIEVPYIHPKEQTESEKNLEFYMKRIMELEDITSICKNIWDKYFPNKK